MSILETNTAITAEASHTNELGGMSSPTVDFSFLDWDALTAIAFELEMKCDEYGGNYPRDNWKKVKPSQHLNSLTQHVAAFHAKAGDMDEHILHIACRAMMLLSTYTTHKNDKDSNSSTESQAYL